MSLLHLIQICATPFVAFVTTLVLVPWSTRLAHRVGAVDHPGPHRIHKTAIPRSGGLSILAGTSVAILMLIEISGDAGTLAGFGESALWWKQLLLASCAITLVGFIDDVYQLRPLSKLIGQTIAATILAAGEMRIRIIFGVELAPFLSVVITILWLLLITNMFNLIDGLDGLAAGLAVIGSLGIAGTLILRHLSFDALALACFIGACLGFLRSNWNPARVFLGDSGSNLLGLFVGSLAVMTGSKSATVGYLLPCFVFAVPAFDTFLAIWRRSNRIILAFLRYEPRAGGVMTRDLEHLHHRLLHKGLSQREVVAFLFLLDALCVFLALLTLPYQRQAVGIVVLAVFAMVIVFKKTIPLVEIHDSALAVVYAFCHPTPPLVAFLANAAIDFGVIAGTLLITPHVIDGVFFAGWIYTVLMWGALPWCALQLAAAISHRQREDASGRLVRALLSLTGGTVLSLVNAVFVLRESVSELILQSAIFLLITALLLTGARQGIRWIASFWSERAILPLSPPRGRIPELEKNVQPVASGVTESV